MELDEKGVDRAGNPGFLSLAEPSPAGTFACNSILVNANKSGLEHRPGWDWRATARSRVFLCDL